MDIAEDENKAYFERKRRQKLARKAVAAAAPAAAPAPIVPAAAPVPAVAITETDGEDDGLAAFYAKKKAQKEARKCVDALWSDIVKAANANGQAFFLLCFLFL